MFIHIGNDNLVHSSEIVLIIDYEVVLSSSYMEKMILKNKEQGNITQLNSVIKSVVFTTDHIYFSPLSVSTLKKRSSMLSITNKLEDYSEQG